LVSAAREDVADQAATLDDFGALVEVELSAARHHVALDPDSYPPTGRRAGR
jgi:hypothetical protein